jgi:hypothetical protein
MARTSRYWLVPLAALAALWTWTVTHQWFATSDTQGVLLGTAAVQQCLDSGRISNCIGAGYNVSHFPLLQYLPTYAMKVAGFSLQEAYKGICWLNAAAYAGTLGLLWHVGRKSKARALAPLLLAAGVASPLLWYSHAGFREALSAFVRALFAASIVLGWPAVVTAVTLAFATISNDPAVPFLLALGVLALIGRRRLGLPTSRRDFIALAAGALAGGALFAAFNVFRYGSVVNTYFLDAHVAVPDFRVRESSFAALVAAPNVGLVWYWPLAIAVLAVVAGVAWRRRRSDPRTAAVAAGVVGVLLALLLFFVIFYSPFGWEAWGPRYLVAWIPALLIVGGFLFAVPISRAFGRLLAPARRFALVATAVVLLALPQWGVFLDWQAGFQLFDPDKHCPIHLPDPQEYSQVFGDMTPYYSCKLHQAWTHSPALLNGYAVLGHPWRAIEAAIYAAALVALLLRVRSIYSRPGDVEALRPEVALVRTQLAAVEPARDPP